MINALISVYYPSETIVSNIIAIASQADMVYVCDNTPASNQWLADQMRSLDNARYICFQQNLGLSQAFNQILKNASISWKKDDYVIFFDQDSLIAEHHIPQMVSIYETLDKKGYKIGCLGPVYFNTSSGMIEIPKAKRVILGHTYAVSSIITSSLLCTYGTLQEIGFWNERIFLDLADWDLCWRIQTTGKLCCVTKDVILQHSLGYGTKKVGPIKLRVGQPFREYYQIRECLYLLGQAYTPIKYKLRFLAMLLIRSPLHILLLDHKKLRLRYMTKGFMDFMRGKKGALETDQPGSE